jgi:hypothetical protein
VRRYTAGWTAMTTGYVPVVIAENLSLPIFDFA